jgi:hypothetical protein
MGDRGYDCMAQLLADNLHSMTAPPEAANHAVTAVAAP